MLNNFFLLAELSENEKKEIISYFDKPICFKRDEVIYSAETFKNALGLILKGKAAAVTNSADGVFMKSFNAGNVFGAAAIFGSCGPYVSVVIAQCDSEVLFISEETLRTIFDKFPKTALNYITFLSDKIRFLNQKLDIISCTNAEDTVYKYLIGIMDSDKKVNLPVSMTLLSKMLGLGRATLYRSFDALEAKGKIKREKNKIKVI